MANENIKDFILTDIGNTATAIEQKVTRAKPKVEYEIVFASGPDFAVRKKTLKSSAVMVVIVSQNQFYIKAESSGGTIEVLNDNNLAKFSKDIPDGGLAIVDENNGKTNWISRILRGVKWRTDFLNVLASTESGGMLDFVRNDMFDFDTYDSTRDNSSLFKCVTAQNFPFIKSIFNVIADHIGRDTAKEELCQYYGRTNTLIASFFSASSAYRYLWHNKQDPQKCSYELISKRWGLEGIKQMVSMYLETPVNSFPDAKMIHSLLTRNLGNEQPVNETMFDLRTFVDYMFCECTRQGYAEDASAFWYLWADYLDQQYFLYGEVRDKYSETLASAEKITSYKQMQIKRQVSEEQFAAAAQFLSHFEYQGNKYSIIAPKTPEDVIEEGRQMSHCVGGYVNRIANLDTYIFFMRANTALDQSLITVEVRTDGTLGQVRARFNRKPHEEQLAFVEKWHNKFFVQQDFSAA